MNPYVQDNEFPDSFPRNFVSEILPENAVPINLNVYRVCLEGVINAEAFQSSFEAESRLIRPRELDLKDPSTYSTSCFEKAKDIKRSLKMFRKKNHPKAIVARGETGTTHGLVLQAPHKSKTSHVNWWIYKGHDVSGNFTDVTDEIVGGE
ncbi:hypothetical protein [Megasphaera sp. ASD88]|uniref:hypothetical protein n=1 Tax=Megasphaera sp. ASD88 TaxID=2027407 RepID=UPI001181558B|nr:hypothetical protein [Megasphaera sp. ASD88]